MSRKIGIFTASAEYGETLGRELGREMGQGWQTGFFEDSGVAAEWLAEPGSILLYEGRPPVLPDGVELLLVPLLEEEPELLRTRFTEEPYGLLISPGIFKYQSVAALGEAVSDIRTLYELRRRKSRIPEETAGHPQKKEEYAELSGERTGREKEDGEPEEIPAVREHAAEEQNPQGPDIYCVAAAGGGTGATTFSAALAGELAKRESTAMLSFDLCPGGLAGELQEVSEVLYRIREYGEHWAEEPEYFSHFQRGSLRTGLGAEAANGARIICGFAGAADLWEWKDDIWDSFLAGIRGMGVKSLVIDLGSGVLAERRILKQARRLFLTGDTEEGKLHQWRRLYGAEGSRAECVSFTEPGAKGNRRLRPEAAAAEVLRKQAVI